MDRLVPPIDVDLHDDARAITTVVPEMPSGADRDLRPGGAWAVGDASNDRTSRSRPTGQRGRSGPARKAL